MKYIALVGASFVFIVLRHFTSQRSKQVELELRENMASALREKEREERRGNAAVMQMYDKAIELAEERR